MNKAMTEAVTAFKTQTTTVALAVMEVISKENSALHKVPYSQMARTTAAQRADLQTAMAVAANKAQNQV